MRDRYQTFLFAILFLMVLCGQSWSGLMPKPKSEYNKISVYGHFGFGFYNMNDMNAMITEENSLLDGDHLEPIDSGSEVGARIAFEFTDNLTMALSINTITAEAGESGPGNPLFIDASAHAFELIGVYEWHQGDKFNVGLGASGGLFYFHGRAEVRTDEGQFFRSDFDGNRLTTTGFAMAEFEFTSSAWLRVESGYRHADVKPIVLYNGDHLTNSSGGDISVSYSGFFIRAGIRVALDFIL